LQSTKRSLRAVKRTANTLNSRPQSLLFGSPDTQPGPGEPGFAPPKK
jgi:phospholipid/cholesterol/gamma-HCH transport system substrate-binding protein